MLKLKTRLFSKWCEEEGITDPQLNYALQEIEQGLLGASLGAGIYKKRIAVCGKGKSGGVRTLIVYKKNDRAIFIYGFNKKQLENINESELLALKKLSKVYLSYTEQEISYEVYKGKLIEIKR
ncbi:MAG: hypothetical protein K0S08_348 [Gammaproteobacteria bacterium]|jgi:hypothetical protein|nr:hypothetical protein [Gammaproteobacteria bacterium]